MDFTAWLSLFAVALLGAMSPGPSLVVIAKNALGSGKINGILTSWAHASGILIYAILTVFGLSIVLKSNPFVYELITYAGALYLGYLGVKSLLSKGGFAQTLKNGEKNSYLKSMQEGFLISLLNPKIGLYFLALFSQFINPDMNTFGKIITVITPICTDGGWYTIVSILLTTPLIFNKLKSHALLIDRIMGIVLILVAIRIVFI